MKDSSEPSAIQRLSGWNFDLPWYHGSPLKLDFLLAGSTITQEIDLASVFSHKPQIVCLEDEYRPIKIRHNGVLPGWLYVVDEPISCMDVYPHPHSSMSPGLEWLTKHQLQLRMIGPVEVDSAQFLSDNEIKRLTENHR